MIMALKETEATPSSREKSNFFAGKTLVKKKGESLFGATTSNPSIMEDEHRPQEIRGHDEKQWPKK
jgi:hypothetical protein